MDPPFVASKGHFCKYCTSYSTVLYSAVQCRSFGLLATTNNKLYSAAPTGRIIDLYAQTQLSSLSSYIDFAFLMSYTSSAIQLLFLFSFALNCAGGFDCYAKVTNRCCFSPNGNDLRDAVLDYSGSDFVQSLATKNTARSLAIGASITCKTFH
jgi:hypothetical protein